MSDPADLTLTEAVDAVRERKLSSLELLDACFVNIARATEISTLPFGSTTKVCSDLTAGVGVLAGHKASDGHSLYGGPPPPMRDDDGA